MHPGPPRRRRARPVADAPVEALLARSEELAKGWLIALLEQTPLVEAPGLLGADIARDAPRLCEAAVRALADDTDLRRLEPGGAFERLAGQLGSVAGGGAAEATSRSIDALRAVIWSALHDELRGADPDQVAELAERLALVAETLRATALRSGAEAGGAEASGPEASGPEAGGDPLERPDRPRILRHAVPPSDEPEFARGAGTANGPATDGPAADGPARAAGPDAGTELGAPLWMGAVADEIREARRMGTPLSLLLVELDDAARVRAVERAADITATFGRFAQAVRTVLRRQDILACESDTRAWVIARDTGRVRALALGGRVAEAVREAPGWRGAPLTVSVGIAVLGEDGTDRESLIGVAEESRFAAQASGLGVVPEEE